MGPGFSLLVNKGVHTPKPPAQTHPYIITLTLYLNFLPLHAFIPMFWFEANSQHRVKRSVLTVLTLMSMKMTFFMPLNCIGANTVKEGYLFKTGITNAYN